MEWVSPEEGARQSPFYHPYSRKVGANSGPPTNTPCTSFPQGRGASSPPAPGSRERAALPSGYLQLPAGLSPEHHRLARCLPRVGPSWAVGMGSWTSPPEEAVGSVLSHLKGKGNYQNSKPKSRKAFKMI